MSTTHDEPGDQIPQPVPDVLDIAAPDAIQTLDPDELVVNRRAAAYVCTGCGIGECLDAEALAQVARDRDVPTRVSGPLCVPEGVRSLREDIAAQGAGRVAIAACSGRVNWDVFSPESLGVDTVERVNVRELVAWSKPPGEEETQRLAGDYLRMGLARSERTARPPAKPADVVTAVLVVGGGTAGITAALEAAGAGHDVVVVERRDRLGGWMAGFHKSFPTSAPYDGLRAIDVADRARRLQEHPRVTVHAPAQVQSIAGMPGAYDVTVLADGETVAVRAGAVVLATGWQVLADEQSLGRLGYGVSPDVVTNVTFEGMARDGELVRPSDGRPVKRVAFVQRPGMTEAEKAFSHGADVVDLVALKQALYVRELAPEGQAYILYENLVAPGLYEDFYRRVQQEPGVFFTKGDVTAVVAGEDGLVVEVANTLIGEPISLAVDLVVLATGMAPATAGEDADGALHLLYKQGPGLPTAKFGLASSNFICFPYETQRTGIYATGCVREPLTAAACVEDAAGAALKAIQSIAVVRQGKAVHPRSGDLSLPHTRTAGCTKCGRCTVECPFSAIELDDRSYPVLNPTRCRRCGICMGACPVQVISFEDYGVAQLTAMVRAIEFPDDDEIPRILAFACENDAYPAFDIAGINRRRIDAAVRVIPLRCLGSLNMAVVADSLSGGIDGIMLMGCPTGENYQCHFIRGSELAQKRMKNVQETLGRLMLEPERITSVEVELTAYEQLPGIVDGFVEQVRALGPNPYKGF